jgi:hypothetical protein
MSEQERLQADKFIASQERLCVCVRACVCVYSIGRYTSNTLAKCINCGNTIAVTRQTLGKCTRVRSKPVVGTVRHLLASLRVQSSVKYTSRGNMAMYEYYYANHDEALHMETRYIPGHRRACKGPGGVSRSRPLKLKFKKIADNYLCKTFYVI